MQELLSLRSTLVHPGFKGVHVTPFLVFDISFFVLFLLIIVVYVLRYTSYDYPFYILKFFSSYLFCVIPTICRHTAQNCSVLELIRWYWTYHSATWQKTCMKAYISYLMRTLLFWKKSLNIPKGQAESVDRRRTDNTMTKRKSTTGQTTINKTYI